jgi:hypothetical protein
MYLNHRMYCSYCIAEELYEFSTRFPIWSEWYCSHLLVEICELLWKLPVDIFSNSWLRCRRLPAIKSFNFHAKTPRSHLTSSIVGDAPGFRSFPPCIRSAYMSITSGCPLSEKDVACHMIQEDSSMTLSAPPVALTTTEYTLCPWYFWPRDPWAPLPQRISVTSIQITSDLFFAWLPLQ